MTSGKRLPPWCPLVLSLIVLTSIACQRNTPTTTPAANATRSQGQRWEYVDGIPIQIAVFPSVFWEPRDTTSLREMIESTDLVRDKAVLEIGTGSGLLSLCCLRADAARVVATDVNPQAIENAMYNAQLLDVSERFEVRQVPLDAPTAFRVIGAEEKFDVILSNPPWEDAEPQSIDEYALYDRNFALLRSLLADVRQYLKPGGCVLLAYGSVDAIEATQRLATEYELTVRFHDDRPLAELSRVFLPGMLLEVLPRSGGF